jgi:transcriptional regulator with XRE-family HTH domain
MSRFATSAAYRRFVDAIVEKRLASGVTQEELARRLKKPQSFISKIERVERRIDVVEFCALIRALGLVPAEVIAQVDEQLPESLNYEI